MIGDAVTRAGDLAERMRELADNEANPELKEQFMNNADRIDQDSGDLLDIANEFFGDPDNAEAKQALKDQLAKLLKTLDMNHLHIQVFL